MNLLEDCMGFKRSLAWRIRAKYKPITDHLESVLCLGDEEMVSAMGIHGSPCYRDRMSRNRR